MRGNLQLEQVSVLNDARDGAILNAVSLNVAAGEVLAIVGPSGAGKSTLARAIAGARLADRGTIRFDGAAQQDWDPEQLARHIGYLPQDSVLFAGTIKENICRFATELGDDPAEIDPAVIAAAEKVGAHDLILRLPAGYDHMLQLGGRGLSAGQAQRIALARAVYGDPALLILDEPNAHLDAEGDSQLIAALTRLKAAGTTVLIVSHKLSILPVVDKMLVLRDGRVEHLGPRDEVLPKVSPANIRRVCHRRRRHERRDCNARRCCRSSRDIRIGIVIAALFFVGFLGWAAFAGLDAAAYAQGSLVVSGQRQAVQHRDGGVVSDILVREGQRVKRGSCSFASPPRRCVRRSARSHRKRSACSPSARGSRPNSSVAGR